MPGDPPDPPARFVNRRDELERLRSHLLVNQAADTAGEAFIHGPVGIGKTALAMQFIRLHQDEFPGGVHYAPSLIELDFPGDAARAAEGIARGLEPGMGSLVIVDNLHEAAPGLGSDFHAVLRENRPEARVIMIGRNALAMPRNWLVLALAGVPPAELKALLEGQDLDKHDLPLLLDRADGNPLLATTIANLVLRGETLKRVFERLDPATYLGLLGPDGLPLAPGSPPPERVGVQLRAVNSDLVERVKQDPSLAYQLSSRNFEEFVAGLYERHGFEVELTPASHDGGVDLYVVRYEPFGKVVTLVECKRNAPDRPVGVEMVRSLYGVLEDKGAGVGVLATTSTFTAGAKAMQQRHSLRLALQDWLAIQDMLGQA